MPDSSWLWNSSAVRARIARGALLPFSLSFRGVVGLRNLLYHVSAFRAHHLGAPAISVGNLSVGGTGKTPFCGWLARELQARGTTPAILLRGYGEDEPLVHALLSPGVRVAINRDRVAAASSALAAGADVLVLDDGFQHRRAARDLDVVLVSADAGLRPPWLLPAGPWREPPSALRRASLVLVTRKSVTDDVVARTESAVRRAAPDVAVGIVRFALRDVRRWNSPDTMPLETLAGRRAVVASAIGDPAAFERQLEAAGVNVDAARFPDHHRYHDWQVHGLARHGRTADIVLCTLKDAVKLGPRWPADAPPLWYVSQRVTIERGADVVFRLLDDLVDRHGVANAGSPMREGH